VKFRLALKILALLAYFVKRLSVFFARILSVLDKRLKGFRLAGHGVLPQNETSRPTPDALVRATPK
jgi:hypothetical protein